MRSIATLSDAAAVLRQHEDKLHAMLETTSVDWHGRRIGNAGASVEVNDYVIRRELDNLGAKVDKIGAQQGNSGNTLLQYVEAVFGIAIDQDISTGLDLCPPHIAAYNGSFKKLYFKMKVAPTSGSVTADIRLNGGDSILPDNGKIIIGPGNHDVITLEKFAIDKISEDDYLTIDVTDVTGNPPGQTLVVKLKYQRTS